MNKRMLIAQCLIGAGIHRLARFQRKPRLIVINYHRLRPAGGRTPTPFDDGVFGPDESIFRDQMRWLRSATTVLDEQSLVGLALTEDWPPGETFSVVTFDDAYVDCYTRAGPILDECGIRGFFFVPVNLIESRQLGWWDITAFLLKTTRRQQIQIGGNTFDLVRDFKSSLRSILDLFKLEPAERTNELLLEISRACDVAIPSREQQAAELMTWEQIRQLREAGHAIGSHTLSHRVLATLAPSEQAREIIESRRMLGTLAAGPISSFAYPVGGPHHYNDDSLRLVREAGYTLAFSFNTGLSPVPLADRFQVPRESASTLAVLRCKAMLPSVMGLTTGPPRPRQF